MFKDIEKGDMLYAETFTLDKKFNKGKVVLHVDECDQNLKVILNGKTVGDFYVNVVLVPCAYGGTGIDAWNKLKI